MSLLVKNEFRWKSPRENQPRAGGLGVMTSPLQGEDRRFDSAPAHHSRRKQKMLGQNFLIDSNIANKIVEYKILKAEEKKRKKIKKIKKK